MWTDEALYMEAGKNILLIGNQENYQKSIGWPFILALVFGLFDINSLVALYLSSVFGALTIFSIFFLTFILTKHKLISFISAIIFSIFPTHVYWSGSAETNIPSLFFVTLTLFFCFLYYKCKKTSLLWLSIVSLAFITQFRGDNLIYPVLFLFGCWLFNKNLFRKISFKSILPWLLLIILSFPSLIQTLILYYSDSLEYELLAQGKSFDGLIYYIDYIFNSNFLFQSLSLFIIITLLSFIGFLYCIMEKRKEIYFLIIWFIPIYFVAGLTLNASIIAGSVERIALNFLPITSIFASYGGLFIQNKLKIMRKPLVKSTLLFIIILIIILLSIPSLLLQNFKPPFFLETKIPEQAEKDIPKSCVIIAPHPEILTATTDLKTINIVTFLKEKDYGKKILEANDCVLFYEGLFCLDNNNDIINTFGLCKEMHKEYQLQPYKSYKEQDICSIITFNSSSFVYYLKGPCKPSLEYTFYKVKDKPQKG